MNSKQLELLDLAYKHYCESFAGYDDIPVKEWFLGEARNNKKFSERWGFKIVEKNLSFEEKIQWVMKNTDVELENLAITEEAFSDRTPNKLVTVTYKGETLENYF